MAERQLQGGPAEIHLRKIRHRRGRTARGVHQLVRIQSITNTGDNPPVQDGKNTVSSLPQQEGNQKRRSEPERRNGNDTKKPTGGVRGRLEYGPHGTRKVVMVSSRRRTRPPYILHNRLRTLREYSGRPPHGVQTTGKVHSPKRTQNQPESDVQRGPPRNPTEMAKERR